MNQPQPVQFHTCLDPADPLTRAERIAGAVQFSKLAPQNIRWLWPDRIPLGRITLLVSDPGLGKASSPSTSPPASPPARRGQTKCKDKETRRVGDKEKL